MLIPLFKYLKSILTNFKIPGTIFCSYLLFHTDKNPKRNNPHKNHHVNNSRKNHNKHKAKYVIVVCIPKLLWKMFSLFSSQNIRMSTSSINFKDKKIKKSDFYNKNKKIFNINDIDVNKILVSKKEQYGKYNSFK